MQPQPYQVIIVDDEQLSRQYLVESVNQDSRFVVKAICDCGDDALMQARDGSIDVAFLDIRMPRKDGFQTLAAIQPFVPLIVFVTAYSDFAVRAFDVEAFDYVTKPLNPTRFAETLDRVSSRLTEKYGAGREAISDSPTPANTLMQGVPGPGSKLLTAVNQNLVYHDSEIEFVESEGNYVKVRLRGEYCLVRETLENFCRQLSADEFVRVHRSFVVNARWVRKMQYDKAGTAEVVLADGYVVPVSRRHRRLVTEFLGRRLAKEPNSQSSPPSESSP